jgi:renin receptor
LLIDIFETFQANNITIAPMYSDEYPVMFNLFFWTSLVLGIIVIAIVYVFLTLDPGADTIIYRMTAPRLKVD